MRNPGRRRPVRRSTRKTLKHWVKTRWRWSVALPRAWADLPSRNSTGALHNWSSSLLGRVLSPRRPPTRCSTSDSRSWCRTGRENNAEDFLLGSRDRPHVRHAPAGRADHCRQRARRGAGRLRVQRVKGRFPETPKPAPDRNRRSPRERQATETQVMPATGNRVHHDPGRRGFLPGRPARRYRGREPDRRSRRQSSTLRWPKTGSWTHVR